MKNKFKVFSILCLLLSFSSTSVLSSTNSQVESFNFWPQIAFNLTGANLCEFRSAYSQSRNDYMRDMSSIATNLLWAGGHNSVSNLVRLNRLYERNLAYARLGLGVTLESTFKAYLDQYYRSIRPRVRKLTFTYANSLVNRLPQITNLDISKIDLIAHGTYSMSPNCNGNIIVTLTVIDRSGITKEYIGRGKPSIVMSQIASAMFEDYQRTRFPSTITVGSSRLTLIGGLNGDIDSTNYIYDAKTLCDSLDARLPTGTEYKIINSYGSWNGGINLAKRVWAVANGRVFVPEFLRNPVRSASEINDKTYYYICIK